MEFLIQNYQTVGAAVIAFLIALHGLALVIVNLTDTPDPDDFSSKTKRTLAKVYPFLEKLAGIFSDKAKLYAGEK